MLAWNTFFVNWSSKPSFQIHVHHPTFEYGCATLAANLQIFHPPFLQGGSLIKGDLLTPQYLDVGASTCCKSRSFGQANRSNSWLRTSLRCADDWSFNLCRHMIHLLFVCTKFLFWNVLCLQSGTNCWLKCPCPKLKASATAQQIHAFNLLHSSIFQLVRICPLNAGVCHGSEQVSSWSQQAFKQIWNNSSFAKSVVLFLLHHSSDVLVTEVPLSCSAFPTYDQLKFKILIHHHLFKTYCGAWVLIRNNMTEKNNSSAEGFEDRTICIKNSCNVALKLGLVTVHLFHFEQLVFASSRYLHPERKRCLEFGDTTVTTASFF